jgi:hypothetical protein
MLRMAGFARLWSYIKYNFVYLDRRPGLNWDGILEQYLPKIAAATSDVEYGKLLQQAVALLKDGHTNVFPNAADPHDSPPILLEPIGGRPVATIIGALAELNQIKPGMELLEIDGHRVDEIIRQELDPYNHRARLKTGNCVKLLDPPQPGKLCRKIGPPWIVEQHARHVLRRTHQAVELIHDRIRLRLRAVSDQRETNQATKQSRHLSAPSSRVCVLAFHTWT